MRTIDVDNLKARLRNSYKRREFSLKALGVSDEAKGIIDSLIDVIDEEPTVALVKRGGIGYRNPLQECSTIKITNARNVVLLRMKS